MGETSGRGGREGEATSLLAGDSPKKEVVLRLPLGWTFATGGSQHLHYELTYTISRPSISLSAILRRSWTQAVIAQLLAILLYSLCGSLMSRMR